MNSQHWPTSQDQDQANFFSPSLSPSPARLISAVPVPMSNSLSRSGPISDFGSGSATPTLDREAPQPMMMYTFPSERERGFGLDEQGNPTMTTKMRTRAMATPGRTKIDERPFAYTFSKRCFLDGDVNVGVGVGVTDEDFIIHGCAAASGGDHNLNVNLNEPGVVQLESDVHQHHGAVVGFFGHRF